MKTFLAEVTPMGDIFSRLSAMDALYFRGFSEEGLNKISEKDRRILLEFVPDVFFIDSRLSTSTSISNSIKLNRSLEEWSFRLLIICFVSPFGLYFVI